MSYSLIIPVHNAEKTLSQVMASITQQTKLFDEILLIENNSTDQSLILCEQYAREMSNVKLISTDQKGPSIARNIGITQAKSEFILFLDADDELVPEFLSTIDQKIGELNDPSITLYEYNFRHFFPNQTNKINPFILPEGLYEGKDYLQQSLNMFHEETKFMSWRFVYRRDFLINNAVLFAEEIFLFEDIIFITNLMLLDTKVYVCNNQPMINYLYNQNSLTQTVDENYYQSLIQSFDATVKKLPEQTTYFMELAGKILRLNRCVEFYYQIVGKNKVTCYVYYLAIKWQIFMRKLKRKLSE